MMIRPHLQGMRSEPTQANHDKGRRREGKATGTSADASTNQSGGSPKEPHERKQVGDNDDGFFLLSTPTKGVRLVCLEGCRWVTNHSGKTVKQTPSISVENIVWLVLLGSALILLDSTWFYLILLASTGTCRFYFPLRLWAAADNEHAHPRACLRRNILPGHASDPIVVA